MSKSTTKDITYVHIMHSWEGTSTCIHSCFIADEWIYTYNSARKFILHGVSTLDSTDLHHIACPSLDSLLYTWRRRTVRPHQKQDRLWNQYLTFLDSVGPFAGECWLTVHASLCWLLDPAFIVSLPSNAVFGHWWDTWSSCVDTLGVRFNVPVGFSSSDRRSAMLLLTCTFLLFPQRKSDQGFLHNGNAFKCFR